MAIRAPCGTNNNNSSLQSIFDVFRKAWSDRNLLSRAIEPIEWIWPTDLFPPQILQKWIDRLNTFACFSNYITFLTSYNFRSITPCFIKEDNFFRAFPCITCKKESYRIWRRKKIFYALLMLLFNILTMIWQHIQATKL